MSLIESEENAKISQAGFDMCLLSCLQIVMALGMHLQRLWRSTGSQKLESYKLADGPLNILLLIESKPSHV